MTSIVYQDKVSGQMFIYAPQHPEQRSFFELKKNERILEGIKELKNLSNARIYLYKKVNWNWLRIENIK